MLIDLKSCDLDGIGLTAPLTSGSQVRVLLGSKTQPRLVFVSDPFKNIHLLACVMVVLFVSDPLFVVVQANGQNVNTDIISLGMVLYEMITDRATLRARMRWSLSVIFLRRTGAAEAFGAGRAARVEAHRAHS